MKTATNIFHFLSIVLLLFTWLYPAIHFTKLPEIIPIHFDLKGNADGFGSRNMVWFIGALSAAVFFFIDYIFKNTDSQLLNIPDSLRRNKPLTQLFVRVLMLITMLLFADSSYEIVEVSLGNREEISNSGLLIIGLTFVVMFGFFMAARYQEKNKAIE